MLVLWKTTCNLNTIPWRFCSIIVMYIVKACTYYTRYNTRSSLLFYFSITISFVTQCGAFVLLLLYNTTIGRPTNPCDSFVRPDKHGIWSFHRYDAHVLSVTNNIASSGECCSRPDWVCIKYTSCGVGYIPTEMESRARRMTFSRLPTINNCQNNESFSFDHRQICT